MSLLIISMIFIANILIASVIWCIEEIFSRKIKSEHFINNKRIKIIQNIGLIFQLITLFMTIILFAIAIS